MRIWRNKVRGERKRIFLVSKFLYIKRKKTILWRFKDWENIIKNQKINEKVNYWEELSILSCQNNEIKQLKLEFFNDQLIKKDELAAKRYSQSSLIISNFIQRYRRVILTETFSDLKNTSVIPSNSHILNWIKPHYSKSLILTKLSKILKLHSWKIISKYFYQWTQNIINLKINKAVIYHSMWINDAKQLEDFKQQKSEVIQESIQEHNEKKSGLQTHYDAYSLK